MTQLTQRLRDILVVYRDRLRLFSQISESFFYFSFCFVPFWDSTCILSYYSLHPERTNRNMPGLSFIVSLPEVKEEIPKCWGCKFISRPWRQKSADPITDPITDPFSITASDFIFLKWWSLIWIDASFINTFTTRRVQIREIKLIPPLH